MPLKGNCTTFNTDTFSSFRDIHNVNLKVTPTIKYINSTQQLQISAEIPFEIEEIKLYTILGQKVKQWTNLQPGSSGSIRLSLSNMSKGTYLVSVKTKRGKFNKRLIIGK